MSLSSINRTLPRGFSLIEVLVALLILSFGVLGVAKMQLVGLRGTNDAYLQGQASLLVNSMAERIRANPYGLSEGAYLNLGYANLTCLSEKASCSDDMDGAAIDCTPAEMAQHDAVEWVCDVKTLIPGAIPGVTDSGGATLIQIGWSQLNIEGDEESKHVSIAVFN